MARSRWLEPTLLLLIVALAAALRLWRVAETPGWFTDEGTHLEIARHLANGRIQYLSVTQSVLLFARLPLFEWLLAGAVRLFGLGMGTLRGVTAVLGTTSVVLLYALLRDVSKDRWLALTAALLLAVFPAAVVYSRFGFSYNLLVPLGLTAVWGFARYDLGQKSGLIWAAAAIGLALITDLWALSLLPILLIVVARRRWRDLAWALPLALLPLGVYTAVSLLTVPDAFWFDWQFTLARVRLPLPAQLQTLALNAVTLLSQSGWLALGIVGLFALQPRRLQRLAWLFLLLPFLVIGRTAALYSLSFYYTIPLLPWAAVGSAALLRYGTVRLTAGQRWAAWLLAALLVGSSTWLLGSQVQGRLETAVDPFLLPAADAQAAADFLNARLQPDDLTILSPTLAWLVNGRVADFQLAAIALGEQPPHIPTNLPAERQLFTTDYRQARFVVIDPLWRSWATFNVPGVPNIMAEVAHWPLVFESGSTQIFQNPSH
ncbi:MAG: glycosyltransferase family 39 protein [Candidatus Promineifilaceae bacterium]